MADHRGPLYDRIGGEAGVLALVAAFYDRIQTDPAMAILHRLHLRGNGVGHSRVEQARFLSGFLGGPRLYVEHHGHSNVRQMHEHVTIDQTARDAWLLCMEQTVSDLGIDQETSEDLMRHFRRVAYLLQNAP
ncbi:group II truncated hemoglobin [Chthonobacter rhizosphaerae]|uniref:group II truncated hemoglobin n=1 Tax=Chthonobacter rhizosphaerae TaxID=2735553 RepID=UPI0015EF9F4F|nr:group II truncated hemoglobin [Chthonobacter rhizosphaerae]